MTKVTEIFEQLIIAIREEIINPKEKEKIVNKSFIEKVYDLLAQITFNKFYIYLFVFFLSAFYMRKNNFNFNKNRKILFHIHDDFICLSKQFWFLFFDHEFQEIVYLIAPTSVWICYILFILILVDHFLKNIIDFTNFFTILLSSITFIATYYCRDPLIAMLQMISYTKLIKLNDEIHIANGNVTGIVYKIQSDRVVLKVKKVIDEKEIKVTVYIPIKIINESIVTVLKSGNCLPQSEVFQPEQNFIEFKNLTIIKLLKSFVPSSYYKLFFEEEDDGELEMITTHDVDYLKKINNEYDYNNSISTNEDDNDSTFSKKKINQVKINRRKSSRK